MATKKYTYEYPRPAVTVDAIILDEEGNLLLVKRGNQPFKDFWALPGGFREEGEPVEHAVIREVYEETSLSLVRTTVHPVYVASKAGRDSRGDTVSVVFMPTAHNTASARAGDDAKEVKWWPILRLPELAFDHEEIIREVLLNKL